MNKDQCSMAGDVVLDHEPVIPTTVGADGTFMCRRCGQQIKWDPVLKKNILASEPLTAGKDFMLTVRIRFQAADDLEARARTHEKMRGMNLEDSLGTVVSLPEGDEIKLQEVVKTGPPRKVTI